MPVVFKIIPEKQIIVFTYSGNVTLQESLDIVATCGQHPAYKPWMRQLCDLSRVQSVEVNYAALLKMQAKMLETLLPSGSDLLVVFYAPTKPSQEMAHMAQKSWEGLNSVIVIIQDRESSALNILGLAEQTLESLLNHAT